MEINSIPIGDFLEFFGWAWFGFFARVVFQLTKRKTEIKRSGGFSAGYWIKDNWMRVLGGFFAIVLGITFHDKLSTGDIDAWGSVLVGVTSDVVADSFLKRKK